MSEFYTNTLHPYLEVNIQTPTYAGHIEINRLCLVMYETKPGAWHRFWLRVLLGWKWVDAH